MHISNQAFQGSLLQDTIVITIESHKESVSEDKRLCGEQNNPFTIGGPGGQWYGVVPEDSNKIPEGSNMVPEDDNVWVDE